MKIIIGLLLVWIVYKIAKFLFGHHHVVEYTREGLPCYALRPRELKRFEEPSFGDMEFYCQDCGKRCVDHNKDIGDIECQIQMWKEEVESQHKFWKDRNPPQCLHCGKTEQELAKESTTNLQKIDNQLVDSPTKVDKENTIDSDIDFTSKSPMFKALEKAFMESYCFHQKKNNEACSDCGRMRLKAK